MNHEIIHWACGNVRITVNAFGAELRSVCVGGGDNLLWSKDEQFWNRVAPNLFPIVGRLKGDQFRFLDKDFPMKQHGFARDCVFTVVSNDRESLRMRLVWNENTFLSKIPPRPIQNKQNLRVFCLPFPISSRDQMEVA